MEKANSDESPSKKDADEEEKKVESDAVVEPEAAAAESQEQDPLRATSTLLTGADATMIGPGAANFEGLAAITPQGGEEKNSAQAAAVTTPKAEKVQQTKP